MTLPVPGDFLPPLSIVGIIYVYLIRVLVVDSRFSWTPSPVPTFTIIVLSPSSNTTPPYIIPVLSKARDSARGVILYHIPVTIDSGVHI